MSIFCSHCLNLLNTIRTYKNLTALRSTQAGFCLTWSSIPEDTFNYAVVRVELYRDWKGEEEILVSGQLAFV